MRIFANRCHLVLLVALAATVAGCTGSSTSNGSGPSADEIKHLRTNQAQEQTPSPVARALASIPIRQWGVRETAVDAIARIGAPAVPALIQSLSDPDPGVRTQAARALARMGDTAKPALPELIQALRDPDEGVRIAATKALGQMGPTAAPALPALIDLLKTPDGSPNATARR